MIGEKPNVLSELKTEKQSSLKKGYHSQNGVWKSATFNIENHTKHLAVNGTNYVHVKVVGCSLGHIGCKSECEGGGGGESSTSHG